VVLLLETDALWVRFWAAKLPPLGFAVEVFASRRALEARLDQWPPGRHQAAVLASVQVSFFVAATGLPLPVL
jgi:hypothetical protein